MAPPAIIFTDWDGTVTNQDLNDYLTDNIGYGYTRRRELNMAILAGTVSFRDGFRDMLHLIHKPFPECIDYLLEHITLDPGFRAAYDYCHAHDIPIVVVLLGMRPIIHALLVKLVGADAAENIEIVSNDVAIADDGLWDIVYRDDLSFGHDKLLALKPALEARAADPALANQKIFYCGDGVSDLSAAREADLLFAKEGMDLITFCEREQVPYRVFQDWAGILRDVRAVVDGKDVAELVDNKNKA